MSKRRLIGLFLITGMLLACNFPMFARATRPTPTPSVPTAGPTDTPTIVALASPSPTVAPQDTSTPTTAPTPSVPMVTPTTGNVNCRSGPDVAYDAVSVLTSGAATQIVGRLADSSWWYVHNPTDPSSLCWVFSGVVTRIGPNVDIPVQSPPPAIADKVTVKVSLPSTVTCGGPNPVQFSGTISTNGPATVQYQWEITGDKTNTTSPQTLTFSDAGTQDAANPGAYNVDCGKYKITLHVTSPNNISDSKDFTVSSP